MQKLIKTTCKIAAEDIGRERAKHIAEKAQRRYQELCLENTSDPKALRAHTFKRIYPAIAVYEALRENGVDREKAAWYIHEYFQRFAAAYVPHLQRMIRSKKNMQFKDLDFLIAFFFFYEACDRRIGIPELDEFAYKIVVKPSETAGRFIGWNSPLMAKMAVKQYTGYEEFLPAICAQDHKIASVMHGILIRTHTIARGDDYCDWWYFGDKQELPEEAKKRLKAQETDRIVSSIV